MISLAKLLVGLCLALTPILWARAGGQFVVTNGSTSMILSPVIDQKSLPAVSNREPSAAVSVGEIRKISSLPYIVRLPGETSSTPNSDIQPKPVVVDGAVTWIRCRLGARTGFCVQWIAGGDSTIYINGGPILLGATNILAVSLGPEYRGPVYATAAGGDSTLNVADW